MPHLQEKVKADHAARQAEKRYVQMQQDIHHLLQMSAAANASRARYQGWPPQTPLQVTLPEASAPRYASAFRPPATNPAFTPAHISPLQYAASIAVGGHAPPSAVPASMPLSTLALPHQDDQSRLTHHDLSNALGL